MVSTTKVTSVLGNVLSTWDQKSLDVEKPRYEVEEMLARSQIEKDEFLASEGELPDLIKLLSYRWWMMRL